jgi:glutamyl endopeptidase
MSVNIKLWTRISVLVGGVALASAGLTATATAAPAEAGPAIEMTVTETGAVIKSLDDNDLRGTDSYKGTGVPADVRAYGAVPVDHKTGGFDDPVTRSIIGADNRVQVSNTTSFPASATVLITRVVNGTEFHHCSGWMYSARLVLTAGHCVYNEDTNTWYTGQLRFYPGANGTSRPYGFCTGSLVSNTGWTVDENPDADYGGAQLNCTIGNSTGWYGAYWTTASLNGTSTIVRQYPGDKPQTQWTANDQVRVSNTLRLYYDNDTVDGSSGSPVYTVRNSAPCVGNCFLAWHAYGVGSSTHNSGARLTESRFNLIAGWR